ncbi:PREDICTED: amine sulfotransferase-like [Amphimedon queenslandica]|uniref:Sulfotransferase domain-containing protein n=1 Tax=Amphimedon queenslandica TaxID=400682 RepID=A0A1X7VMC9_AMPQE|nr:PREDICTED: amine sulfotransferase-like [Amphimedon queenslandica]|eukprot:XP_003383429.1 PREDICTED: amine sulfotransferase-like [Amphimedon queenslandica]
MVPRDVKESFKTHSPDGKKTPTRDWTLKLFDFHERNKGQDDKPITGEYIDGVLLPTLIKPGDVVALRQELKLRETDVFVATFPKCGTTWTQQIVKLIWSGGREDGRDVDEALPWIDVTKPHELDDMPSPRGFKTHLPYHLCPGGDPRQSPAKYIYVYRNPKDTMVSNYHFSVKFLPEDMPWSNYYKMMLSGDVYFGNIFDHMRGWYIHKDLPNVLIISYEMLKKDSFNMIKKISDFLGYQLQDDVIADITKLTSFEKMRGNELANNSWMDKYRREGAGFMRKGVIGDWKSLFSEEESIEIDEIIKEKLSDIGLVFDYDP